MKKLLSLSFISVAVISISSCSKLLEDIEFNKTFSYTNTLPGKSLSASDDTLVIDTLLYFNLDSLAQAKKTNIENLKSAKLTTLSIEYKSSQTDDELLENWNSFRKADADITFYEADKTTPISASNISTNDIKIRVATWAFLTGNAFLAAYQLQPYAKELIDELGGTANLKKVRYVRILVTIVRTSVAADVSPINAKITAKINLTAKPL